MGKPYHSLQFGDLKMTEDMQMRIGAFVAKVFVVATLSAIARGFILMFSGSILGGFAWVVLGFNAFCLAVVVFLILAQR